MATDYGLDLSCTMRTVALEMPDGSSRTITAVQPPIDMSEVAGRTCLAEALVRRLTSPRGTLPDVVIPPSPQVAYYGYDVTQFVNSDMGVRDVAQVGANVDAEMRKDERVVQSATAATFASSVLLIPINITDGTGPFSLVLAVGNVTTAILSAPT